MRGLFLYDLCLCLCLCLYIVIVIVIAITIVDEQIVVASVVVREVIRKARQRAVHSERGIRHERITHRIQSIATHDGVVGQSVLGTGSFQVVRRQRLVGVVADIGDTFVVIRDLPGIAGELVEQLQRIYVLGL